MREIEDGVLTKFFFGCARGGGGKKPRTRESFLHGTPFVVVVRAAALAAAAAAREETRQGHVKFVPM